MRVEWEEEVLNRTHSKKTTLQIINLSVLVGRLTFSKNKAMKLSSSLLQAITLGVSVTAISAATTSCEKKDIKKNNTERATQSDDSKQTNHEPCPACGMG